MLDESMALSLTSPAFSHAGLIPAKYTCDGENVNPALHIGNAPKGTVSFVLVMDDPDIPESVKEDLGISKFDHWVIYNIPSETTVIPENSTIGIEGKTTRGTPGYVGSCPPDREHRYYFRLYALPDMLSFDDQMPSLDEVEAKAREIAIEEAVLMGRYERKSN